MGKKITSKNDKLKEQKKEEKMTEKVIMPKSRNDIMTKEEVCEFLNITENTLHKWVESGKLPCIRLSRKLILYNRNSISQ